MYNRKLLVSLILLFILFLFAACSSPDVPTVEPITIERIVVDDFREDNLTYESYKDLFITYPKNWVASLNSDDNAMYFYLDNGTFTIYCRDPGTDYTDLNTKKRHIVTDGYSAVSELQCGEQTWEIRSYTLKGSSKSIEGFLATTEFGCQKYFVFTYMDTKYDMHDDFREVLENIHFEEDLSMYYDGKYKEDQKYPLVTVSDVLSGSFANQIIAIDATLGNYRSLELQDTQNMLDMLKGKTDKIITSRSIHFDIWLNDGHQYICIDDWDIYEQFYSNHFLAQFDNIDDGDIVRLYLEPRWNGSLDGTLVWIELNKKSSLKEQGIEYPIDVETEPIESDPSLEATETTDSVKDSIVFITKSGSKFHTATCRWVSNSCIEISYSDAVSRGYTPCKTCNPSS